MVEAAVHLLRHDGGFQLAQWMFQLKSLLLSWELFEWLVVHINKTTSEFSTSLFQVVIYV